VALALALAAMVVLLAVPLGTRETASTSGERTVESTTLLQSQGAGALVPLAVPVLLTALPLSAPRSRRPAVSLLCAALLGIGVVLSVLSIGVFFVPALIAAVVASLASRPSEPRD
jgi:hypothetical protein